MYPAFPVNDDSDAPLKVRPHWRIIGNYRLTYGGTHGHATAVFRAAANANENARLMKRRIRKEAQKDCLCLDDVFSYK